MGILTRARRFLRNHFFDGRYGWVEGDTIFFGHLRMSGEIFGQKITLI